MYIVVIFVLISTFGFITIIATDRQERRLLYIFKPLTTCLIILLALLRPDPVSDGYKALIVVALGFSLGGDIALMLPEDKFMEGLLSFFAAHVCYVFAFATSGQRDMFVVVLIPIVVAGIGVLTIIWNGLGKLKGPVLAYVGVIMLMAWMAITRAIGTENADLQDKAILAAIGAVLFMTSDAVLAVNRFRFPFRLAEPLILSTYFAAQTLIALSI